MRREDRKGPFKLSLLYVTQNMFSAMLDLRILYELFFARAMLIPNLNQREGMGLLEYQAIPSLRGALVFDGPFRNLSGNVPNVCLGTLL